MDKNLVLLYSLLLFNFLFVFLNRFVHSLEADQLKGLLPYKLDDANKNLKLKISLDSIKLKISDSLFLECPLGKLKPATFMFLTRESVDFISRFSIQLNETFSKNNVSNNLAEFMNQPNSDDNQSDLINQKRKGKIKLTCKWSSIDLNREIANLTLFLNKPKDNSDFNTHLLKYFDQKQDHALDLPKIVNRKVNSKPIRKEIGDKATFFCKVRNQRPQLKINWFKKTEDGQLINLNEEQLTNRNAIDMSNYVIRAGRLSINELSKDDFAEYVCRASNDYGEDYAFYKLEMIESKDARLPKIDSFEDLDLKENRSVLLNCSITSYDKFGIQWFEYVDCKQSNCKNQKNDYNYFFILYNEYYKPIDTSKFNLITYNKIHYLSTYFLNKSNLVDTNKYICMVRNENGYNYKMMTLTVNKVNKINSESSTLKFDDYNLLLIIFLSVVVFVLMIILFVIFFKLNKLKKKMSIDKEIAMPNNLMNNFSKDNFKNQLTTNDYYSKNAHLFVPLNKQFNNKSLKNSQLINNLVENGRNSNLLSSNYSFQCLTNKDNRSKLSSIANSIHRLNNTPIQDDLFNSNL